MKHLKTLFCALILLNLAGCAVGVGAGAGRGGVSVGASAGVIR